MTVTGSELAKVIMRFGIDVGYHNTKVAFDFGGNAQLDMFLSTIKRGKQNSSAKVTCIEYNGVNYIIGSVNGEPTEDLNKLNDDEFKIFFLTAIARNMPSEECEVYLSTGVPIEFYNEQGAKLRSKLENTTHEIFIYEREEKRVKKTIRIKGVKPFPQCAGITMLYPEMFEDTRRVVIDMGGKTMDISCYDDGEEINRKTLPLGSLDLYKKLKSELQNNPDFSVNIAKMECSTIFQKKTMPLNGEIRDMSGVCNKFLSEFAGDAINSLKDNVPEFHTSLHTYTGGTAALIKDFIPKTATVIDDIYFNAKAFHAVAVAKFRR